MVPPTVPDPDVDEGIEYWATQPANYDGVLGGFGSGSLPRVDALGSRQFLMYLMPELCAVPSAVRPLHPLHDPTRRIRALDVGAGIGRVTGDVLLHLVQDVVLVEPVESLVNEAWARGRASAAGKVTEDSTHVLWKGIKDRTKSVTFVQGTLQDLDPCRPLISTKRLGRVGYEPPADDLESPYDIIWCQWCLGCLSDPDLVAFLKRSGAALRDPERSLIIVKENLCSEPEGGGPRTVFDETDSSLTRSDLAWKKCFSEAGLSLIHEQVQRGFPEGLYVVKMYALRRPS
ncbi:DUF858-domain-containing protein [Sparassis latifolia]|uniref:Alpha N-terminal protein methyltransferase 1 n=1 Tax=Sparassis crispa TaxID=139825 RepID=A0A401GIA7_9APHY|nr:Alpha N-terminal protein methyltransferase 1 [Sparassis crispa]GBE81944.1 Alpha N-terminal protein methyltransferase 1 [Sparassis crispa]